MDAPSIVWQIVPQFAVMCFWMSLIALVASILARRKPLAASAPEDPSNLIAAVVFGGLYALVLLAVAAAKVHFGAHGLYLVAALSGLTDMDAITLSTAQLINAGRLSVETGWRMMLLGALSNILFKGVVVALLGDHRLLKLITVLFTLSLVGGGLLLLLWP
ncbi:MAG: DUF4010 domain-containing protein [Geobacteraceae bacterium]